jgi:flavin reductase (DIM6/NTAB) family NADH-FMN oxidoreductase RutF
MKGSGETTRQAGGATMFYDPVDLRERKTELGFRFNPIKSLVIPRPIAWVSTLSASGVGNLAPFSFFNMVAFDPPVLAIGCNGKHADGGLKDTLVNVGETGEFVVNLVTWELREKMLATAAGLPRDVDEMAHVGLDSAPSVRVAPPRVAASPINFECTHLDTVALPTDFPERKNNLILGVVVGIHIDGACVKDGLIDVEALKPLSRLGYADYSVVETIFSMGEPS